ASRIEHRLTANLHGPYDVRADDVVGAMELGGHPVVVIRQAQSQRADPVPRQQPAQTNVSAGVCIPLRQYEHGSLTPTRLALSLVEGCREISAIDGVVFRMRRDEGARKRQN